MAQAQTRRPRVQSVYQLLSVVGPSAGVDLRTSPSLLPPERAQTLVNWSLTNPGELLVRPGYTAFSTTSLGSGRIQGAARIYLNTAVPTAASTTFTLVGYAGSLYNQTDSGGWVSTASPELDGLLSTSEYSFPHDRDLVAVLDGSTTILWKSTNGSSWVRFGIVAGGTSTATSTVGGDVSSGEYEFSYTYKSRGLAYESNGSSTPSTVTLSPTTGAFKVEIPNSTDAQVDAIVLYARDKEAGESVLRKVSSQVQGAGTSSTLSVTSTNWTTNDEIPTNHNTPTGLSFGVVWKNRWWARDASVTNRLRFTELFLPQAWPALFFVDIPFRSGDAITALVPLGDTLIVFGTTDIFVILGQTSLDFEVRPAIASEEGAFGFRSVTAIEQGVVHVGAAGVYLFDGGEDRLLSFDLDPAWRDLVNNAALSNMQKTAVAFDPLTKELRVSVPRRYPSGSDGEWVLDLNQTRQTQRPAWSATDRTIGGYAPWDGPEAEVGNRHKLLSWHSSLAQLFEEGTGTTANSSNMVAEYEGPGLSLGVHRARWVDMRGEVEPHAGTLTVEPVIDGKSHGSQTVSVGSGASVYGTGVYGTATYAGVTRKQFYVMWPLAADGRQFVLKLNYTGQEAMKVYAYHPGLVPETAVRSFAE